MIVPSRRCLTRSSGPGKMPLPFAVVTLCCLVPLLPPLYGQTSVDQMIKMSDGVLLDATVLTPDTVQPQGGFPAVVLVHGLGGSKTDMIPIGNYLATKGYASLEYSVRGQGNSGGFSSTMGPRESQDLLEVIQFFRKLPAINPEKIGVGGGSQGGIHAWMAATRNMPGVKVIATLVGPPTFALDLIPNKCIKERLQFELTLGSVRFDSDRDRVRDFIIQEQYDSVFAYSVQRDLFRLLDSVRIPVLQSLGWADNLFPVNGAIRTLFSLGARAIPVWSTFGTNGHGEPLNLNEYTLLLDRMTKWFDHWLKDSALAQATLPVTIFADDRPGWPHHETIGWPPTPSGTVRLYLSGTSLTMGLPAMTQEVPFSLQYDPGYTTHQAWDDHYGGTRFVQAFKSANARFLSLPLVDTLDVTGVPMARLRLRSAGGRFQGHIRIFDVTRADTGLVWRFLTRGTNGLTGYTAGTISDQTVECQAVCHLIPPGDRIGVEVTSLDMWDPGQAYIIPYFVSTASSVSISPSSESYIDLPLIGKATFAEVPTTAQARPAEFLLHQNYPNPFNPSTTIRFSVAARQSVTLEVYSVLGQRVAVLVEGAVEPGTHEIQFHGGRLASGVYLCRLTSGGLIAERKMILMR